MRKINISIVGTGLMGLQHIKAISKSKKAIKKMLPMQDGDVKKTWASISKITKDYNFQNNVSLDEGKRNLLTGLKCIITFDLMDNY